MRRPRWDRAIPVACLLFLASCGGGGGGGGDNIVSPPLTPGAGTTNFAASNFASNWQIGPVVDGDNKSKNMPSTLAAHPEGLAFDFPNPSATNGHVNYVTFRHGSLSGKKQIRMRYRIEADASTNFYPKCCAGSPSSIVLYFQRKGDNWSTDGWRWWSTFSYHMPLKPGEYELVAPLEGSPSADWTSVSTYSWSTSPGTYQKAIEEADRVGFTFGGGDGWGHGVYATAPAKFILKDFVIE